MFRRKPKAVSKEIVFPTNLSKLGLFVNREDQLRQIEKPDEGFDYFAHGKAVSFDGTNTKERLNERRREAVDECMRSIALLRLEALGLKRIRMPIEATSDDAHLEILISPSLSTTRRILLLLPDAYGSDLGIWNTRVMTNGSLSLGSMQTVVSQAADAGYSVVIGNPSQLFWDKTSQKAMTHTSYKARDRTEKILHNAAARIDTEGTTIPGHAAPEEHIASLLQYIKSENSNFVMDIITVGYTAHCVLKYLHDNWSQWEGYVHAVALAESTHSLVDIPDSGFRMFLAKRARNFVCSPNKRGTELELDPRYGCSRFSSEETHAGNIVPNNVELFRDYLKVAREDPDECNPDIPIILGDTLEGSPGMQSWRDAMAKLKLDDLNVEGWTVPGAEEVEELKKASDARKGGDEFDKDWEKAGGTVTEEE